MKLLLLILWGFFAFCRSEMTSFMQLHIPLNLTLGFLSTCDQEAMPDPQCFTVMHRAFFPKKNTKTPFLSHKHLSFIFYYNWISQTELYKMNNRLAFEYMKASKVLNDELSGKTVKNAHTEEVVPRIFHKFWITHEDNPFEVPDRLIELLTQFIMELGDVKVYVWVQNPKIIKQSLDRIKALAPQKIEVRQVDELIDTMTTYMKDFYYMLYNKRYLTKASDLLRMYALYYYGGVFTDLDITIKKDFMFILKYDMTVFCFQSDFSYLAEIFFMAFSVKHPALKFFIEYWEFMDPSSFNTTHVISAMNVHWRMTFLYVYTVGAFQSAFNQKNDLTYLFFTEKEMREMIQHKKELSWAKSAYGNESPRFPLFNATVYDAYVATLSRPNNITINHYRS